MKPEISAAVRAVCPEDPCHYPGCEQQGLCLWMASYVKPILRAALSDPSEAMVEAVGHAFLRQHQNTCYPMVNEGECEIAAKAILAAALAYLTEDGDD